MGAAYRGSFTATRRREARARAQAIQRDPEQPHEPCQQHQQPYQRQLHQQHQQQYQLCNIIYRRFYIICLKFPFGNHGNPRALFFPHMSSPSSTPTHAPIHTRHMPPPPPLIDIDGTPVTITALNPHSIQLVLSLIFHFLSFFPLSSRL